jgi:hypothetical protein
MSELTDRQKGFVEGYACALDILQYCLTGDSFSGKSYDPATIEGDTLHSYAFDLKRGGRHHSLKDFLGGHEICELMLKEILEALKEEDVKLVHNVIESRWAARNYPDGVDR